MTKITWSDPEPSVTSWRNLPCAQVFGVVDGETLFALKFTDKFARLYDLRRGALSVGCSGHVEDGYETHAENAKAYAETIVAEE